MSIVYMITNRSNSILRGLFAVAFGVLLVAWPLNTVGIIVKVVAAFLIAVGVISLFLAAKLKKSSGAIPVVIFSSAVATLLFGTLVFLFPNFFVGFIAFLFGALILVAGLGQLANLYYSSKHAKLSGSYFIIPILITLCGIMLFFFPGVSSEALTKIFGYTAIVYGVSDIMQGWKLRDVKFTKDGKYAMAVEDVKYVEVELEEVDNKEAK